MHVLLNGEERELSDGATVQELVDALGGPGSGRGVAVALEGNVVPHSEWADTELAAGVRIEVLTAVQGG